MDNKNIIDSSPKKSDNNADFDIRNLMNYDLIRRSLAKHPTELCLFEVTCILINNNLKNSYEKDNNFKDNKKPK
tara:strand:- start:800 stop:1021 length:222 start_codon:yes stop_codon:yes gene_type:complete